MNILQKYNIYINSNRRLNGTPDNFEIQLEKPIKLLGKNTHFEIYLSSIEYPFNFKQVNINNNTLFTTCFDGFSFLTSTLVFPVGNYTIITLLNTFKDLLVNAYSTLGVSYNNLIFSYSKITGLVSLTTSNISIAIDVSFSNTDIGLMMGFINNQQIAHTNIDISDQNVNVNPTTYICIRSNTLVSNNNDMESITSNSNNNSDILCKVPIKSPPGYLINHSQPINERVFVNNEIINIIDFSVTNNKTKQILNNGGLNFSFEMIIMEVKNESIELHARLESNFQEINNLLTQRQNEINKLNNFKEQLNNNLN